MSDNKISDLELLSKSLEMWDMSLEMKMNGKQRNSTNKRSGDEKEWNVCDLSSSR